MKITLKTAAIASALVCAAAVSLGWSTKAEAHARIYIGPRYAVNAYYHHAADLPWYAVRAYYWGGPWSGPGYSYAGWSDYAGRNGIGCRPGTIVKGADGIWYNCQ